jgi:hypothetical protein
MKKTFLISLSTLFIAGVAWATPVLFTLQSLTGTVNNRSILVQPDRSGQTPLWVNTNLVPVNDFSLQPVGGQVLTNLAPWGYTIRVDGWPRSVHIVVPTDTNTWNVVNLINTNQFSPLQIFYPASTNINNATGTNVNLSGTFSGTFDNATGANVNLAGTFTGIFNGPQAVFVYTNAITHSNSTLTISAYGTPTAWNISTDDGRTINFGAHDTINLFSATGAFLSIAGQNDTVTLGNAEGGTVVLDSTGTLTVNNQTNTGTTRFNGTVNFATNVYDQSGNLISGGALTNNGTGYTLNKLTLTSSGSGYQPILITGAASSYLTPIQFPDSSRMWYQNGNLYWDSAEFGNGNADLELNWTTIGFNFGTLHQAKLDSSCVVPTATLPGVTTNLQFTFGTTRTNTLYFTNGILMRVSQP